MEGDWKNLWKNILNDKKKQLAEKLDEEIFEEIYFSKYKNRYASNEYKKYLSAYAKQWNNNNQYYNMNFVISVQDIEKAYPIYHKYGGKKDKGIWKKNWKKEWINILTSFAAEKNNELNQNLFEEMYFYKYKDESKIPEMLEII